MKNIRIQIIAVCITAIMLSCAPKPKVAPAPPTQQIPIPTDLKTQAANGKATIFWKIERPTNFASGGYNIYISENPPSDTGRLYNDIPYPGDTDGDASKESFEIGGLSNGHQYEVWVRMLSADGKLGQSSEKILFIPVERGQLIIYFDVLHDSSGYNFAKQKYTKARDYDNDFYLYDKDGPHISSPSLYNSGLKETIFENLAVRPPKESQNRKKNTSMALSKTDSYGVLAADKGYAQIKISAYIGSSSQKRAIINYMYYKPGTAKSEIDADSFNRNFID